MAEIVHKLLVAGVLALPVLLLAGLVLRRPPLRLCVTIILCVLLAVLPYPGDSRIFPAMAGALWPLSAGLAVGLAHEFAAALLGRPVVSRRDYGLFTWLVIALAVLVYPAAFGAHVPDVYALGYSGWTVPAVMALILAAGMLAGSWLTVAWIAVAALWTLAGIAPGANLWDSLIDPVIVLGAVAGQWRPGIGPLSRRSKAG